MKGWRTVIFNLVWGGITALAVLSPEQADQLPDEATLQSFLKQSEEVLLSGWMIGNMILRAITNTPIFRKQ